MQKNNTKASIDFELGKIPPQAIELEEIVIGAYLIEPELKDKIHEASPEIFYKEANQKIYNLIKDLYNDRKPIDILTVTQRAKEKGVLEEIGGAAYITALTSNIASAAHFDYHLTIVKQKFIQREIIRVSSSIQAKAFNDEPETIEDCEAELSDLITFLTDQTVGDITGQTISKITEDSINNAARRMIDKREGNEVGISIPIGRLQDILGGWQKSDLVLIAARPSMGKTAVAVKFAKHTAKRGYKTLFFSLEMPKVQLNDRAVLGETDIDPTEWRNGDIDEEDIEKVEAIKKMVEKWPFIIYDKAQMKPEQIRAICKKEKPDIIFIDYLQLMKTNAGRKYENRNLEIGSISEDLKAIAKDFDIPVVTLSQLSREVEKRGSKIPQLSDLRDSGSLEQDADVVIFPYRPFRYSEDPEDEGIIQFVIAKHRNGEIGTIEARHNQYMNDFYDKAFSQDLDSQTDSYDNLDLQITDNPF